MNKIKILNIINGIILGIIGIVDFILGIFFHFDLRFYYSTVLFLAATGLINLIFIALKEAFVLSYDSKRFLPVLFGCHVFFGVMMYYIVKYINKYEDYIYLYWVGLLLEIILPGVLVYVLEKIFKKKKNKGKEPKFIVNRK